MLHDPQYSPSNLVQLERGGPVHTVFWRGQQKLRNDYGTVVRQWVYRLDDGYWDCHHEEELHGLGRNWD